MERGWNITGKYHAKNTQKNFHCQKQIITTVICKKENKKIKKKRRDWETEQIERQKAAP